MYFEEKHRIAVWIVSIIVGFVVVMAVIAFRLYVPDPTYLIPISQKVDNILALGIMIFLGFPAIVEFSNYKWGRQVDKNIPRLLRDIAEAVRSGLTLPKALEEASKRSYGPLSRELEHAISMFTFGASFEDSLLSFARRLKRPGALRFSTTLIEAHQTGGKLVEVLNSSVEVSASLEEYKAEQNTKMRPYMMTMYLTTFIFLIVAYIMLHQFLGPLSANAGNNSVKGSGLLGGIMSINYYNSLLFWASILESMFAGLMLGKIVDRNLSAGLQHSVILMMATLVFFNISKV